jgi:membrane protein YdbS with pleckstrin-like domain
MLRWLSRVRRRILPLPHELIGEHLGPNEKVGHSDSPSFRAFLFNHIWLFLLALVALGFFVASARSGQRTSTAILALIAILLLFWLGLKRLGDHYTIYVLTNARVLKINGLLTRRVQSIPLGKVTDLSFKQSVMGRLLSYATVRIESANEESGLRDLSGVKDPIEFNKKLVSIVVKTQGSLPEEPSEGLPPPPGAGWPDGGQARSATSRRARTSRPAPSGPVHDVDTLGTRVQAWRDAIGERWRRWRSGGGTP